MSVEFHDDVNRVLDEVRELTQKDIAIQEREDISTVATIKPARANMEQHILSVKPDADETINHLVPHECGHILRMFSVPEPERKIPITTIEHYENATSDIQEAVNTISQVIGAEQLDDILQTWIHGLIRQLTNFPSDIQIERWIYQEYPDLRPFQKESIEQQYQEAKETLGERVRQLSPPLIYKASNMMNFVYYDLYGRMIREKLTKPYYDFPYLREAKSLSKQTDQVLGEDYTTDIATVNMWAKSFGVEDWFTWTDFENVPADYGLVH